MTFAKSQGLRGPVATEVAAKLAEAEMTKNRTNEQLTEYANCTAELEHMLRLKQQEVEKLKGSDASAHGRAQALSTYVQNPLANNQGGHRN
jgi:hypothetical protein